MTMSLGAPLDRSPEISKDLCDFLKLQQHCWGRGRKFPSEGKAAIPRLQSMSREHEHPKSPLGRLVASKADPIAFPDAIRGS